MALLDRELIQNRIIAYLSPVIKEMLSGVTEKHLSGLEEIRLRAHQPLLLKIGDEDVSMDNTGKITRDINKGYLVTDEDIYRTIASISDNSLYAFTEDIKRGFITVPGGNRVGLAGQIVMQGNDIKTIKDFSSICFRVAREIEGCARPLIPYVYSPSADTVLNTLIISPPRCGKTTILRDLARIISVGEGGLPPQNVVIVDERSELAGSYRGIPQLNVGPRTDVLDACPKAQGMVIAVRSLSPRVIITDEIGRQEDVAAIQECVNAGVAVITSIHAGNLDEVKKRPVIKDLLNLGAFKIGVVLSRNLGPGTLEEIIRWD